MPARIPETQNSHTAEVTDKIVISGISGRLPESSNIEEFKQQLFDGVDLVTDDERRWPSGLYGLPKRTGKLKDIASFDATFFGVHAKQAHVMDPQLRLLLEVTYEAMVDAGVNPTEFRGSNTGVFVGVSTGESSEYWSSDPDKVNGYGLVGCCRAMFANRISYSFDLSGPSFAMDSACSSSLLAFQQAVAAINSGQCDSAIVGGVNLLLQPTSSLQFQRLSMMSPEGMCKAFDSTGSGYVRAEAVVAVLLQKASVANRIYATVLGAKSNTDGSKEQGITFPSGQMQNKLIKEVYSESGIDPADVVYVEAHGTGTKVGDPQEVNSIVDAFCKNNRKAPLMIGSVKSNMGHSEPASGVCALAKLVIAMESGVIPANLHYENPNTDIPGLLDGTLKVISKNEKWNGGIIGVNSFGFGGANVHVILSSNPKPKTSWPAGPIPRLITVSGRTEEAVHYFMDKIKEHSYDEELYALVDRIHKNNIVGHNYRGFSLLGEEGSDEVEQVSADKRPIWFIFSGMGSQWPGMGKALMNLEPFKNSITRSADTLKPYGIDLIDIIVNGDDKSLQNVRNTFVSLASFHIALVDVIRLLKIEPDGIIGHSVGEVGCAYADRTCTAEQAILLAYARGTAILESKLEAGAMAAVGLTWDECKKRCPPDVYPVCHNGEESVTISGPPDSINKFVEELTKGEIFAKAVNSSGYAFHSKYIADAGPKLKKALDALIPSPKARSSKWISSSIPESAWNTPLAQFSSASYHVNNLLSPVYFHEATKHIPDNAIVLEFAPHALLQAILKRSLPKSVTNVGLLKRGHPDNVKFLLSSIGKIYKAGAQPDIAALYPPVTFPVGRGTPMLASMIKWDHSIEWSVADFSGKGSRSGELVVDIDLSKEEFGYLSGHAIDGRVLFPATGYMTLVWKTFAKLRNQDFEQLPVVFEDVKFSRATIMPREGSVKFLINIFEGTGEFEICESGSVAVSGRIYVPDDIEKEFLNLPPQKPAQDKALLPLNKSDVYKELRLRGYDYDGCFRGITGSDNFGFAGKLAWEKNWVSFIDTMLQFSILGQNTRHLCLPTRLQRMIINPKAHIEMNSNEVPVYMYRNISVIKAGAIELRGMKASLAPRRQHVQASPKLEKYQFIPLENNASLTEDSEKSVYSALTVASQLVFENSSGAVKLKVVEAVEEMHSGVYILPKVKEIMEAEPMLYVDGTVVTSTPIDSTVLEEKSIKVAQKDITEAAFEQNAHLVILSDVLLNGSSQVIANAISSLKPGGFILFEEPKANPQTKLITKHSLEVVYKQATTCKMYILARTSVEIPDSPMIVKITEMNYNWVEPLKEAMRLSEDTGRKIYILCQGEELSGLVGMINCVRQEAGGVNSRCIFIQDKNAEPFSTSSNYYMNQLHKDLVQNVLRNGVWGTYRHLLLDQGIENSKLQVEHAYINTLTRGDLSSLKWIEGPLKFYKGDELCTVYYAPLNFRDIMLATGKLPPDALPGDLAGQDCILGLEFSGRDSKGRRVMGMVEAKSMATTVVNNPDFLWEVPEKWSLEEAATVPAVYGTSYYALVVRGRIQPGETILIHAGSGGVGQASISIALHMGCKVFTTVGSQVKRNFLKKRFPQLTDDCIGNSRDTSFEQMILTETNGRGVDLVLNSLAGELLLASVRCLALGGRFLEIGKVDLSNNSPLGMSIFLKNTTFHGILLDALFTMNHADTREVRRLVTEGIANGAVRPLQNTIFTESQAEQAFRFMASGKHIGKVSLKIRDEESRKTMNPSYKTVSAIPKSYMDPEKVYILVGGLGGFGLELTSWLITRGAKKIVLSSRSGVKSGYQSLCLRRWKNQNVTVHISTADVTTADGAKKLINESNALGPVGAIFNLAAVLRDAMMDNQSEEDFKIVCRPKIDATKHLDAASRMLTPHLDYFVVFSSVSCGRGNGGQVNYGYANSAMERICEDRHAAGLPAVAIQWGAIGDVGLVLETMTGVTEVGGTLLQNISSCLSTMDVFLQQPNPVVSSIVLAEKAKASKDANQIKLTDAVANILGLKDPKSVSALATLADLGMDSLMGAEIKQTLERNYDFVLNAQEIRALTFERLLELETGSSSTQSPKTAESPANNLVHFDGQLMPTTPCIKMASKEGANKTPVFLIHPIEGVVDALKGLAKEIQAPVYGLQCTTSAPLTSIADLAKHYIAQMKKVQEKGPYKLIGYSFGACVAFEIGVQLEANNEKVKLMFIDGSPEYIATHTGKAKTKRVTIGDIASEQSEVALFFIHQFKEIDFQKMAAEFTPMKSWEERVKNVTKIVSSVSSYTPEQIAESVDSFYKKLVAGDSYKPSAIFKGDIMLVKASDNYVQLGEDYGLTAICKQKITIKSLEGTHRTILNNPSLFELANKLCQEV